MSKEEILIDLFRSACKSKKECSGCSGRCMEIFGNKVPGDMLINEIAKMIEAHVTAQEALCQQ